VGEAPEVQRTLDFDSGDEVVLASDGLFNHPHEDGGLGDILLERLNVATTRNSLHQLLVTALTEAGRHDKAEDDITVLTVCRLSEMGNLT
jgi:serine phosphatase RsbU (regulator of sigma subunit)